MPPAVLVEMGVDVMLLAPDALRIVVTLPPLTPTAFAVEIFPPEVLYATCQISLY